MRKTTTAGVLLALLLTLSSIGSVGAQGGGAITFDGDRITADGSGATVDGNTVTITSAGTYTLSGTLTDGQIIVDSDDDGGVSLVLDNVDLTSSTSAPIAIMNAAEATLILPDGTNNVITDAATYVYKGDEDEPNAAVFSNDDLTISGNGSLTVHGNYNDGIASDDTLTFNGELTITVDAVDDAIVGKDALTLNSGTYTVTAGSDAFKSDNEESLLTINQGTFTIDVGDDGFQSDRDLVINQGTFSITALGDGIHAEYNLTVNNGDIDILMSEEGIEAAYILINNGNIDIVSTDDGINVSAPDAEATEDTAFEPPAGGAIGQPPEGQAGEPPQGGMGQRPQGGPGGQGGFPGSDSPYYLHIYGGHIVVNAEGDGLDSNGSIEMTNGVVIVNGTTAGGNGALDYDGTFNISGGLLVAVGSAGMPQAPSDTSTQNSVLVVFDQSYPAGTLVAVQSESGDTLLTFAPEKDFQSIVVSSPQLAQNATYTVYVGGSASGDTTDGLTTDADYTPGTSAATFTVSSAVTQVGNVRRMR